MTRIAQNAPRNPYQTLAVPADASPTQINRAYRALLRTYHPDTRTHEHDTPAADKTLAAVIAAYYTLGDPARRAAYDHQHLAVARPTITGQRSPIKKPTRAEHSHLPDQPPIQASPIYWTPPRATPGQ